jgi:Adenylate kinase
LAIPSSLHAEAPVLTNMAALRCNASVLLWLVISFGSTVQAFVLRPPTSSLLSSPSVFHIPSAAGTLVAPSLERSGLESRRKQQQRPTFRLFRPLSIDMSIADSTSLSQAVSYEPAAGQQEPRRIIIAGAPASGKGTQCAYIQQRFGVVHLSTGDMLRAAVAAGTPIGNEAKAYMDSGRLVPDSTMIGVVRACQVEKCALEVAHFALPF